MPVQHIVEIEVTTSAHLRRNVAAHDTERIWINPACVVRFQAITYHWDTEYQWSGTEILLLDDGVKHVKCSPEEFAQMVFDVPEPPAADERNPRLIRLRDNAKRESTGT